MKFATRTFKIILTGFVFFSATNTNAQLWAGIGYHASFPMGLKNLNYVVDKYNSNNSFLTNKLNHFSYMDGFCLRAGFWKPDAWLDFGFTGSGQRVSAAGVPTTPANSKEMQEDLKITYSAFDVSYGILFKNEELSSWGLGVQLGFGSFVVKHRYAETSLIKSKSYENMISKGSLTFGFVGRYMMHDPGFTFEPYVRFGVLGSNANAVNVNNIINPSTSPTDKQSLKIYPGSVGLRVMISITTR